MLQEPLKLHGCYFKEGLASLELANHNVWHALQIFHTHSSMLVLTVEGICTDMVANWLNDSFNEIASFPFEGFDG